MSLQVWLPLNGNLKNNGLDISNVTTTGTTSYTNGRIGKILTLSGGNNVKVQYNNISTEKLSICFWIKPNSPSEWSDILSMGSANDRLEKSSTTTYYWYSDNTTSNLITSGTSLFTLTNSTWNHFAMICDGTNVKFYINGKLIKTIPQLHSISTMFNSNPYIFIGSRISNTGNYRGYLNDFRVYDNCLSTKEIYEMSKGLVLHYKLSENGIGGENLVSNGSFSDSTNNWITDAGTLTVESDDVYGQCGKFIATSGNKRIYNFRIWL